MTSREQNKVNLAIRRGLARCRGTVAPIVELARYLDDLHSDPAWNGAEIRIVESAIRHILARLVKTDSSVADRTDIFE
jgi:hypothetical protein